MSLTSMTGFARAQGAQGAWRWMVEIKCVNAKGLDLRLRIPPAFDRIEADARARLAKALARGTVYATLTATREGTGVAVRVDEDLLAKVAAAADQRALKVGELKQKLIGWNKQTVWNRFDGTFPHVIPADPASDWRSGRQTRRRAGCRTRSRTGAGRSAASF